jgi:uncharacterized membrane protein YfcA
MTPLWFTLIVFGSSIVAGVVGALLGLGGGIIVVPLLTLALGIDIRFAIGASIVAVIATSSGAAAAYVREGMTNLRVAMFLETATAAGALTGAFMAGHVPTRVLFIIFGAVMAYSAVVMLRKARERASVAVPPNKLADRLRLHGEYYDESLEQVVKYRVTHTRLGWCLMYVAGMVSGLLGIGSGVLKVPTMDIAMRLPIKVSSATSNFMIGVTAAASAILYFARGDIHPFIAAPVAAGVLIGSVGGSRMLGRLKQGAIRYVFVAILVYVAIQMLWKGGTSLWRTP